MAHRGAYLDVCSQFINVVAGKWYIASAYVGGFNCAGSIVIDKYNSEENQHQGIIAESSISGHDNVYNKPSNFINAYTGAFANGHIGEANRIFVKFKAPDTGKILLVFRLSRYARNQTYADFFIARAMLQECTEYAIEPSPWQNTGVTAIHGGSIVTNSITAQQMAADSVTANQIAAGAVAAKHIAVGSIGAEHIATRSLTSDKLNVSSLSAISSDIGSINAGDITGVNIHGNNINGNNITGGTISGTTVRGSTVEGGTIRGAWLDGVNGRFTGTLEVTNLVGGNLCEVFVATVRGGGTNYQVWINISPSPVKRIFFIVNSHKTFTVEANQSHRYLYTHFDKDLPPEFFDVGGGRPKICIAAYAISNTTTITQD